MSILTHAPRLSYEEASLQAQELVRAREENFTVASRLMPPELRVHLAHIYAFCRGADDAADETGDADVSLRLLARWREELDAMYAGTPTHPVFIALAHSVERFDLPRGPFDHLLDAFIQDQELTRYATWEQLVDYSARSANPVGRLVLMLFGYRDAERQRLSDATCTALQLTNFWQDVRRDLLERDRIYLPGDIAARHGLSLSHMASAIRDSSSPAERGEACDDTTSCGCGGDLDLAGVALRAVLPAYRATVAELVERTWPLFEEGRRLWPRVTPTLRPQLQLYTRGGEAVLRKIERLRYDTLTSRPRLGKLDRARLGLRAAASAWFGFG